MKELIRIITLLLICVIGALQLAAEPITQQQAQQNVQTFLESKGLATKASALRLSKPKFTSTDIEYYYVFNIGDNDGYVIAAGDDCAPAILGYAVAGSVAVDSMPENMKAWLEEYVSQIEYMQEHQLVASPKLTTSYNAISPLMTTTWGQKNPYNLNCPDFFSYGKSVTGCVATAMAQVMYYHRANSVTQTTAQIPAYDCSTLWVNGSDTLGHIHVDAIPAGSPIDWANMLDSYSGSSTTAQQQAVANLMKYCGAAVKMNYANSGSGGSYAYSEDVPIALKTYFNYSNETVLKYRSNYSSNDAWENLIYNELSNSRPVYYSGRNSSGGHAFVCDGYDGSGYYHINWGWSSTSDGYFLLTALDPSQQGTGGTSSGYNQNQAAVINAEPKSSSPSNPILATSVSLNKTSATVTEGNTLQLTATVLPTNATNRTVTWKSSNTSVATVSSGGLVTAKSPGSATITATTTDGTNLSATCALTVQQNIVYATSISLNKTSVTVTEGNTLQLTATVLPTNATNRTVTWKSSNTSVATVNSSGLVTAKSPGSATITATTTDGTNLSASCAVTVQQNIIYATSISLNKTSATMTQGNTMQLTATVLPTNATNRTVTWKSSNTSVATVSSSGLVAAKSPGSATITATTTDGTNLSANCYVTVESGSSESTIISFVDPRVKALCVQNWDTNGDGELSKAEAATVTNLGTVFKNNSTITSFDELQYFTGLTSIGEYAFSCCWYLTSITIPSSVTSIGYDAFSSCSRLTGITIPSSVVSISNYAFDYCSGLTNITIPSSVTSIGAYAFRGCSGLASIKVDSNNPKYDSRSNCNAIIHTSSNQLIVGCKNTVFLNSVTSIGDGAFDGCTGLTNLTIPSSITYIGSAAFNCCSGLANVKVESGNSQYDSRNNCNAIIYTSSNRLVVGCKNTIIPNSVTTIGDYAFNGCNDLTNLTIPNSVTSIGSYVFDDCSGLTSITIPKSVTSIGIRVFEGCSGLTSMKVESGNSKYDSRNNCNAIIETNSNKLINGCKNTTIPNTVTSIGEDAFSGCNSLTSISIPASIISIGDYAFHNCTGLSKITCFATTPPVIYSHTFPSSVTNRAYLYVLAESLNAYHNASYWKNFIYIQEIPVLATSISLNQTSATLYMGNTLQLIATVLPSATTDKTVSWSSNNTSVATVSSNGLVTPKSTGSATITVRTEDGSNLTAQCIVTVKQYATSISLSETNVTICTGNTLQLTATVLPTTTSNPSVTWSSSNTSVATVSSSGVVTAKSTGSAVITAKTVDGSNLSASCNVTVKQLATSISLNKTSETLYMGNTLQLIATVYPNSTSDKSVSWSSSNTAVATVSSDGLVTPKSTGTATIIVRTKDGSNLTAQCVVTVKQLASSISLNKVSATLYLNQTLQLAATVSPSNATDKSVVWSSSNNSIATVSSTGLVTAIATGNATITATTADGSDLSATCVITVKAYVTSLTFDQPEVTILEGDTITLIPTILPSYATNQSLYWSSSNTSVASVNNGVVVGRSGGETTITARTSDGSNLSATCKVTVVPNFDISMPNLSHLRGSVNNKFDLTIDLANRYDITGMQFDIQFPDGVTIAKDNNGEFDILLDDTRKSRNHTATASLIGNNTYRILVSSATANSLKGHSGTVVHIMIDIPLYHVSGNKQVKYSNIILSEPDETRHTLPTKYSMISYYYMEGDANADVSVDVADYVITGNYILQNGPENFWYDAANVDHNSTIDVNDLTGITNIALGRREGGILQMPAMQASEDIEDIELTANPLAIEAGQTKTLNFYLDGIHEFAGFQMDLELPKGIRLVDASLVDENSGFSIATAELTDGRIRLLSSSFSLKSLAVSKSAFLKLTLMAESGFNGNDIITLDNVKFSERNMDLHTLDNVVIPVGNDVSSLEQVYSVTLIYAEGNNIIIDSPESGTARIVTISGITQVRDVVPGHNVIPMEDSGFYIVTLNGTTAKLRLN